MYIIYLYTANKDTVVIDPRRKQISRLTKLANHHKLLTNISRLASNSSGRSASQNKQIKQTNPNQKKNCPVILSQPEFERIWSISKEKSPDFQAINNKQILNSSSSQCQHRNIFLNNTEQQTWIFKICG